MRKNESPILPLNTEADLINIVPYDERKYFIRGTTPEGKKRGTAFDSNYRGTTIQNLALLRNERFKEAYRGFAGIKNDSRKARRDVRNSQSINKYTAGERLSPRATAQKILAIFDNVESIKMPRSNGSIEVATRRADGLYYFAGKNTPCYLEKGETVSKNIDKKESWVTLLLRKTQRRTNALLPKDVPRENRIKVSQSKAPSLGNIYSAPFEKNPKTGTTLCSRTARLNLSRLLGPGVVPAGDARPVHNNYPNWRPKMVAPYQRGRPEFNPPENANVADIFIDSGSKYGHRVAAYVNNGKWFILDPYYFGSKQTYPKPLDEYLAAVRKPIGGIGYYRRDSRVA